MENSQKPLSVSYRIIRHCYRLLRDFLIFALTLVGYIPVHEVRKAVYRLAGMKIGRKVGFHWCARFYDPHKLSIGNNTVIGVGALLDARRGIKIGNNVVLGMSVMIWTLQHDYNDADFGLAGAGVTIDDRAWINCRAIILPGVRVGEGAVVAAGAVVTRDVAPFTVVGGVPAREIASRTHELRYALHFHKAFQ